MIKGKKGPTWLNVLALVLIVPVLVLALLVMLVLWPFTALYSLALRVVVERVWVAKGKRILLVYSRSPVWQDHIESTWLPRISDHAIVLNWSDRSTWRRSSPLAARVFRHWAPRTDFNPMVILFPRFPRARRMGFYYAFRDWKHGNGGALETAERKLFEFANELGSRGA